MSTTTTHAYTVPYTVPESLIPGHLHPNTQRKYREVLRKFQVTQETTWPDVLAAVNAVANINTRRTCIMVLRQVLGREGAPAVPRSIRRTYDLPSAEAIPASKTNRSQRARAFDPSVRFARSRLTPLPPRTAAVGGPQEPTTATLAPLGSLALLKN